MSLHSITPLPFPSKAPPKRPPRIGILMRDEPPLSRKVIVSMLLDVRIKWLHGKALLQKHGANPHAFLREMNRILEILQNTRERRDLTPGEKQLEDDILDDYGIEELLAPDLGGCD
jgi:hypothetical protein